MNSTPSVIAPESKPVAPLLSETMSTAPDTASPEPTAPTLAPAAPAAAVSSSAPSPAPLAEPSVSNEPATNTSSPVVSIPSEARPVGGRRNKSEDETNGPTRGQLVPGGAGSISSAGLQMPGKLLNDPEEKGALKIKVHLNLHAKVRLDLDAQIYGDVVIGLL